MTPIKSRLLILISLFTTIVFVGLIFTENPDVQASVARPNQTTVPTPPRSATNTPLSPTATPRPLKPERGTYIVLFIQSSSAGTWTIVQWQDALGGWHDVEGWQGMLDDDERKQWWVAPKDFNTGPFRWLVYERQRENLIATSEPFYLPSYAGEVVNVAIEPSSN